MSTHATWLLLALLPLLHHDGPGVTGQGPGDATTQLAARTAEALNCLGYLALGMPGLEEVRAREGDTALSQRLAEDARLALRLTDGADWVPPDAGRARAALVQLQALAPNVRWGEAASVAEAVHLAREALTGLGLWPPAEEVPPGGAGAPTR